MLWASKFTAEFDHGGSHTAAHCIPEPARRPREKGKRKRFRKICLAEMIDFWEANMTNEGGNPVRDPGSVAYSTSTEIAAF
jgi:hypothetical protein